MSTIDTSTWSPDSDLNVDIGGIPLNADASIQQTWQAIQMLMAALKGDTAEIKLTINQPDGTTIVATNRTLTVVNNSHSHTIANVTGLQTALDGKAADADMTGATASADGASGLVPKPEAGDQDKVLKGDGTWGTPTDTTYDPATESTDGLMSAEDKTKLDGIASGAQVNIIETVKVNGTALAVANKAVDVSVPLATATTPKANGTASVGSETAWAKGDHVHPQQTSVSGNAGTASALASNFTIKLEGDVSGSVSTNGTGTATISTAVADDSHSHVISNVDGLQTQLDAKAADSGVVHNSGDETIAGGKTFSSCILTTSNATLRHTNASGFVQIGFAPMSSGATINIFGKSYSSSGSAGTIDLLPRNASGTTKTLHCAPDGTLTWDGQAIQTASDERLKTHLSAVPDAVLDAWSDVQWGQFQFLDAVSAKGESARLHLGLIAQRVKAVFEARGLDACRWYGILCHEVHPAKPAVFDEHGEMLFPAEDAVDLWTVRYAEAQAMEAAYQRRRADRLEKRLADLEARMTAMEVANV